MTKKFTFFQKEQLAETIKKDAITLTSINPACCVCIEPYFFFFASKKPEIYIFYNNSIQ